MPTDARLTPGWEGSPVEGPIFAERVREAEQLARRLERNRWDFEIAPELFTRAAATCDVAAKEIVNVYDGRVQTRLGRLVMKGAGTHFSLMSHETPPSVYVGADRGVFDDVNRQIGSKGLYDFAEFREVAPPQEVEFYNPEIFYQMRHVVFWHALHGSGLFPSGFEDLSKRLAEGNVLRNQLFAPALPAEDRESPVYMQAYSGVRFPTSVLEWMAKPLYGGMSEHTLHIDTVLTPEPYDVSHPYLPLVAEGGVVLNGRRYHMRRFAGVAPKEATRGPGVPAEGQAS